MLGSERIEIDPEWTLERGVPKPDFLPPKPLRVGGVGRAEATLPEERTVPVGD